MPLVVFYSFYKKRVPLQLIFFKVTLQCFIFKSLKPDIAIHLTLSQVSSSAALSHSTGLIQFPSSKTRKSHQQYSYKYDMLCTCTNFVNILLRRKLSTNKHANSNDGLLLLFNVMAPLSCRHCKSLLSLHPKYPTTLMTKFCTETKTSQ